VRQQPPLGSGAPQVEDCVDDAAERVNLSPSGRMAAGDKGREQRPFDIIEIAGVGTDSHGGAPGSSNSPHPQQQPSTKPMVNQTLGSSNKIAHQPLKRVIGNALGSRAEPRRATEVAIAVHALNRMLELGRPKSVRSA
jgi:hypothetical protein